MKNMLNVFVLFLMSILVSSIVCAAPLPIDVNKVEVDGTIVSEDSVTRLDVERDNEIEIEVEFEGNSSATEDTENVILEVFISGYEYSDFEPIHEATSAFDIERGVEYNKKLKLKVPRKLDEGDYKLRLMFTDANNDEIMQTYDLKVDVPRHSLEIKDVVFSPEGAIKAGKSLLTTVRLKNLGQKDEESVKVHVSVPALEASATDYIDDIDDGDSVTSEELYMKIPACAESGTYDGKVTVTYREGYESESYPFTLTVFESDVCELQKSTGETLITVSSGKQDVSLSKKGIYPVTLSNLGATTKTYAISVDGTDEWGEVTVDPSNVVLLEAGETQVVFVYVLAKEGAQAGEKMFSIEISSEGEAIEGIPLMKANVSAESASAWNKVQKALEIGLIVLVILVVLLFLILGFNKLRGGKEEDFGDEETAQTYY